MIIQLPVYMKKPWCAELQQDASNEQGVKRNFIDGTLDDTEGQSGRPCLIHYQVDPGKIYELCYRDLVTGEVLQKLVRVEVNGSLQVLDYNATLAELGQHAAIRRMENVADTHAELTEMQIPYPVQLNHLLSKINRMAFLLARLGVPRTWKEIRNELHELAVKNVLENLNKRVAELQAEAISRAADNAKQRTCIGAKKPKPRRQGFHR